MTLAPIGKAAFLAGGATMHSVLNVPANEALTFHRLDRDSLNTIRTQIGHIKLWLIDEISLVGHRLFLFTDQRADSDFRKSIIIKRSLAHLSARLGTSFNSHLSWMVSFFRDLSRTASTVKDYDPLALNLWMEHFTMFELTHITHRQNCISFAELLRSPSHCTPKTINAAGFYLMLVLFLLTSVLNANFLAHTISDINREY